MVENETNHDLVQEIASLLGMKDPTARQLMIISDFVNNIAVLSLLKIDRKLTAREQFCLYWSAKGKSSAEIADLLHIKKSTVDSHKKRIMQKLRCANMTQAVYEGMRIGLLPPYY